jgi:hypothetical protein
LHLAFSYWGDFEGAATNFDGFIVEISSNGGANWSQVDPGAAGELTPTYDATLAGTGQLGNAWAYCYTTNPDWIVVASQDLVGLGYVSPGDQVRVRFTFAYDALSGGQGFFVDDVYIGALSPPDLQPPVITHTPLVDTPDTLNPYTVSATITDLGTGVNSDSVKLYYSIEGATYTDIPMTETSPDVYEADIPAQLYHTDIFYYIQAMDNAGNWGTSLVYNFEVTNAITLQFDDGQPYFITSGLVPGDGLFVQYSFVPTYMDSGLLHQVKLFFDGPGEFDLEIFDVTGGLPGALIDEVTGLQSLGYEWYTEDITSLDIRMNTDVVVGYTIGSVAGGDTARVLQDPTLEYPNNMWVLTGGFWANPTGGGDFMIRLKVIPLGPTAVEESKDQAVITLAQLAPSIIKTGGTFTYQVATAQNVRLNVYDVSGTLIRTLVDEYIQEGTHHAYWNGKDEQNQQVANGIYFFNLSTENETVSKKALIVR